VALTDGGRQHIVDLQSDIRTVIPIKNEWELVRRLDSQHDKASVTPGFSGTEAYVHPLLIQEMDNEVADRVLSESGQ
jgi:hypothetical protein